MHIDKQWIARISIVTAAGIILLVLFELFAMWHQITTGMN